LTSGSVPRTVCRCEADPLDELVTGDCSRLLSDISACGLGELVDPALDRFLFGAYSERRHPATLQREHAALGDHPPCPGKRLGWGEFAGGLLEHYRAQLAGLERRGALGQSFFDAILKRTPHRRALAARTVV